MPNYCDWQMKVKGEKDNIITLLSYLQAQYSYDAKEQINPDGSESFVIIPTPEIWIANPLDKNDKSNKVDHHLGYRVFEAVLTELREQTNNKHVTALIQGCCAWSVYSCMFDGPNTYFEDRQSNKALTMPEACKLLHLTVEIYSSEPGMGFSEHYIVGNKGTIKLDEEKNYMEFYLDNYYDYDEFKTHYEDETGDTIPITKTQFDKAVSNLNESVIMCDFLNEDTYEFKWYLE